jgi:HD-GYP domain-containing protein (c-di-GMP phosphodiesterase class II)
MTESRASVRFFVFAVCIAATAAIVLLWTSTGAASQPSGSVIALVVLSVVAHSLASRMPKGGTASVAFVPLCAALMLAPTPATVLLLTASIALVVVLNRSTPLRILFNAGQAAFGLSLAAVLYLKLGGNAAVFSTGRSIEDALLENTLPSLALLAAFLLSNSLLVSAVISLASQQDVLQVWKANTLLTIVHLVVALPASFLVAWIAARGGIVWVASLALPLFGMRQMYKQAYDLQQVNQDLLELMIKAIEARDPYTSGHSRRVSEVSRKIASGMQLPDREVENVRLAGLLHDVGKIHEVFAPILQKPGKLTEEEWEVMKTHPALGAELVATVSHLRKIVPLVRGHHEAWNGSGYPDRLAGELIPLGARIITVADTIDALTTDRPYRQRLGPDDVRAEIVRCRGTQFDPHVCDVVLSAGVWDQLFPGTTEPMTSSVLTLRRRSSPVAAVR